MRPVFLHCCISRLLTLTSNYIEAVTAVFTAVGPFIMFVSLNSLESHNITDLGSPSLFPSAQTHIIMETATDQQIKRHRRGEKRMADVALKASLL